MAALVDRMELSHHQRVELYEEGVTWLVQQTVPDARVATSSLQVKPRTTQASL
jgi:hypothetical protein